MGGTDIYTFDLVTGTNTQITFDGDNDDPRWSPDGTRIAFTRSQPTTSEDIYIKRVDNSQSEQVLLAEPGNQNPSAWIDSNTIAIVSGAAGNPDLFTLVASPGAKPIVYLQAPWPEAEFSVDRERKLAAFVSGEAGTPADVWIRDFPSAQGKWRVSSSGGRGPRWSPDGRYLYYWRPGVVDTLLRVRVDRIPAVVVGAPERVLALDAAALSDWDIHPDGKRFIVTVLDIPVPVEGADGTPAAGRYLVVQNWFTELRALTAKARR